MFQRILALILVAMLAFPALAQDAGPLELAPGMRAYTTRVFVEPEVLAELSVGDEVSFYVVNFTAWDYPHADGFDDTFVVVAIAQSFRILALNATLQQMAGGPLREVIIRVEGGIEDIQDLSLPTYRRNERGSFDAFYPRWAFGELEDVLSTSGMVVMVHDLDKLPIFCEACETLRLEDFKERIRNAPDRCYRRLRRGIELTLTEIPCRDD